MKNLAPPVYISVGIPISAIADQNEANRLAAVGIMWRLRLATK